jgi:pyruvate dehydrogenase E2 component (dihydrolipoamide acetyltransferase)
MAEVIRMPKMSDTMTEGVIVAWHKKVGDAVKPGDILAEVETDKATMELENYVKGTLLHIGIKEGASVPVDSVLAVVGKEGEDFSALLEGGGAAAPKTNGQQEKEKEKESESAAPSDKSESAAPADKKETQKQPVAEKTTSPRPASEPVAPQGGGDDRLKASPLAKMLARDKGIDIRQISGSGDNGRIVKKDIENFKGGSATQAVSGQESFDEVAVSQMRKTIAKRLAESKFTAPHFYLTMEINMDKAVDARTRINELGETKISMNDIIIKAAAAALRKNPKVNSSWLGDRIRMNNHIHVGVAIAVDDGLLVPVVKFADQKALAQISREVKSFSEKAHQKKLQPSDWEGNTFTISNLGMFGIEEFTAIINPPDACILAVGAVKKVPAVVKDEIKVTSVMKVTLSCDHRVVDGVVGSMFLNTLKMLLEEPMLLLL